MPSRPFILGILLFWFGAMGWMFFREYWPKFAAGEPPPIHLDLADEVGGRVILWEVFQGDERIGTAQTKISRKKDRTFDIRNDILFTKLEFEIITMKIQFKRIGDAYRITSKGELKKWEASLRFEISQESIEADITGEVKDGLLTPRLTLRGPLLDQLKLPELQPTPIPKKGGLLNVLHPQNKIPGLFEGRSWVVPTFDPLAASFSFFGREMDMPDKVAVVTTDELAWEKQVYPCWRIDIAKPGKQVDTRIWVRRSDDLVLQQQALSQGQEMTLKRVDSK